MKSELISYSLLSAIALSICQLSHAAPDLLTAEHNQLGHDCIDPQSTHTDLCERSNNLEEYDFPTAAIPNHSIQLDVRPADCQSFFEDYLHTRRGLRIEGALQHSDFYNEYENTVTTFPVVDFINDGHIRVVKSRDLSALMFNTPGTPGSLFDQIMLDAESIESDLLERLVGSTVLTATVNGRTTTLSLDDVRSVTIDIVIQAGMASPIQIEQIRLARLEVEKRWGFSLQIIEIP